VEQGLGFHLRVRRGAALSFSEKKRGRARNGGGLWKKNSEAREFLLGIKNHSRPGEKAPYNLPGRSEVFSNKGNQSLLLREKFYQRWGTWACCQVGLKRKEI